MPELVKILSNTAQDERTPSFLLDHKTAIGTGVIEPGVLPLVNALNIDGVCQSISSCQRHLRSVKRYFGLHHKKFLIHPFVMFQSDIMFARKVAQQLSLGQGKNNELNYYWTLSAHFTPDNWDMVWTLKCHYSELINSWNRNKMNADFEILAEIINQINNV